MHPSMASIYRERVANPRQAPAQEGCQAEAAEIMRTLIDKIVLTPVCRAGKETLWILLQADLAGILGLAAKAKGPLDESDPVVGCTNCCGGHRATERPTGVSLTLTIKGWATPVETEPETALTGWDAAATTDRRRGNNRNRVAVF